MRLIRWILFHYRQDPAWFWVPLALSVAMVAAAAWYVTTLPGLPDWSGACTFPR